MPEKIAEVPRSIAAAAAVKGHLITEGSDVLLYRASCSLDAMKKLAHSSACVPYVPSYNSTAQHRPLITCAFSQLFTLLPLLRKRSSP
ncbi:hypothetical protein PAMP_020753 [Pampus punctatissimus]